jgi:hypothetical protein
VLLPFVLLSAVVPAFGGAGVPGEGRRERADCELAEPEAEHFATFPIPSAIHQRGKAFQRLVGHHFDGLPGLVGGVRDLGLGQQKAGAVQRVLRPQLHQEREWHVQGALGKVVGGAGGLI